MACQTTALEHAGSVLQEAPRQILSTAERPLSRQPQSQQGALQEALPLPALVAPALAVANQDHAYLRWKAVIHSMPSKTAAAQGPDFPAARWFHDQMSYKDGSADVPCNQGRWIKSCCFCCCCCCCSSRCLCQCLSHCPAWLLTAFGCKNILFHIWSTVASATSMAAVQHLEVVDGCAFLLHLVCCT